MVLEQTILWFFPLPFYFIHSLYLSFLSTIKSFLTSSPLLFVDRPPLKQIANNLFISAYINILTYIILQQLNNNSSHCCIQQPSTKLSRPPLWCLSSQENYIWFQYPSTFFIAVWLQSVPCKPLFIYCSGCATILILLYVDDIIFVDNQSSLHSSFISIFGNKFEVGDICPLSYFLGLKPLSLLLAWVPLSSDILLIFL